MLQACREVRWSTLRVAASRRADGRAAPQVEPPEDIEVPKSLLGEEEVARPVAERRPAYVPLARGDGVSRLPPPDPATGPAAAPPLSCAAGARAGRRARQGASGQAPVSVSAAVTRGCLRQGRCCGGPSLHNILVQRW